MNLREFGEFKLIDLIRQRSGTDPAVVRGIGDDAAELTLAADEHLLTSTDLLLEGVHFRFDWTDPKSLGRKAVAVNLSDIAAMGGTPRFLYLSLACPGETELEPIETFLEGVLAETAAHGVALVGGDTCASPGPWVISVTVEGSVVSGRSVGRGGARPGDVLMVSGTLGDSALALAHLQQDRRPPAPLLKRHLTPAARVELGQGLAGNGLASAMIDISDGLLADLEHILQASGCDALLDQSALPLSDVARQLVGEHPEWLDLVLGGGEDYELLFAVPPPQVAAVTALAVRLDLQVTVIGGLSAGSGAMRMRRTDGQVRPLHVSGYDHFCRSNSL